MKVWLIHAGEPLPIDGPVRLFRYGIVAQMLAERGHHVTQWAPTFNHFTKEQRADSDRSIAVNRHYHIELLKGCAYQRHASWQRIRFHRQITQALTRRITEVPRPDVIVAAIPTLGLATAATEFASRNAIPAIVDIRDLWPDVFLTVLPRAVRAAARPLLQPLERQVERICRKATAITGVSREYLAWGLRHAGREPGDRDRVFHLGYRKARLTPAERLDVESRWDARGVTAVRVMRCCYFGTLGNSSGVESLIAVARRLAAIGDRDIEFVICGKGPQEARFQSMARGFSSIRFLGWARPADIDVLMQCSDVGLALYESGMLQSLPNKPIEYFSGGLPVLSTLPGELEQLLRENQCGATCRANDTAGLAAVLRNWRASPCIRRQMSERAGRLFREQFEAERVYSGMITYLEELVEEYRGCAVARPGRTAA